MKQMVRKVALIAVCLIGYFLVYDQILKIGCPFKNLTKRNCPGCGMTRAYSCVLRGDLKGAFFYHPLFFLVPLMCLMFVLGEYLPKRLREIFWTLMVVSFSLCFFVRL